MSEIILPPVMGLFCTGYVLHRAWHWWHMRRLKKQIMQVAAMRAEVFAMQQIMFVEWGTGVEIKP